MGLLGDLFSRLSSGSDSDGEDWTTNCRNCGDPAVNSQFCSTACSEEYWNAEERNRTSYLRPRYNTNPNCPACGGSGSCQLCEDNEE